MASPPSGPGAIRAFPSMKFAGSSDPMDEKTKVTILTSSYRIRGYIDLLPGARITDFMSEARDFIAVINAEAGELQGGGREVLSAPVIDASRDHIEIILPGH